MITKKLQMNKINSYFITKTLLLTIFLTKFTKSQTIYTDKDCINENTNNLDFLNPRSKLIKDPNQCITKGSQCCYVEVNYEYGWTEISNNYCALLTGNIEQRIQQISGTLTDQSRYYADFTYNNFQELTSIGNNLDYIYYKDFTCQTPPDEREYYSYANDNCALQNEDGTCRIVNDKIYANEYTKVLYNNYTASYCTKKDPKGKCLGVEQDKNFNPSGMNPLMDLLEASLISEDGKTPEEINRENQQKQENEMINYNEYSQNFYAKCTKVQPAKVRIICPESYIDGSRILLNKILLTIIVFMLWF